MPDEFTIGDLADVVPETDEPPLCGCGKGYSGHSRHGLDFAGPNSNPFLATAERPDPFRHFPDAKVSDG